MINPKALNDLSDPGCCGGRPTQATEITDDLSGTSRGSLNVSSLRDGLHFNFTSGMVDTFPTPVAREMTISLNGFRSVDWVWITNVSSEISAGTIAA